MTIRIVFLLALLVSCAAAPAQKSLPDAEAGSWLARRPGARVLDTRPAAAFAQSHLAGAQPVPDDSSLRRLLKALPKNSALLLYGKNETDAAAVAKRLHRAGYTDVRYLEDGIAGWYRNGYPIEGDGVGMTRTAYDSLLQTADVVLVDFYVDWCGYCPPVRESAERLAREHAGTLRVIFIDADLHPDLCASLGVGSFPRLYLYQMGGPVWKQVGYVPHAVIDFKVRRGLREQLPVLPEEKVIADLR